MEIVSWMTPHQVESLCEGWAELQGSQMLGYKILPKTNWDFAIQIDKTTSED
jgi:hypothetical protein